MARRYAVLVGSNGSVDIAFINSLRVATVQVASSLLYCSAQREEKCMTLESWATSMVIVGGGVLYALSTNTRAKEDR
jgi:hypothetical protein